VSQAVGQGQNFPKTDLTKKFGGESKKEGVESIFV
jgi:hypothetical protein